MVIRSAVLEDLPAITKIGAECYTPEEQCTSEEYRERLLIYPRHFWVLEDSGALLAFINGPVTDISRIQDRMFHDPSVHREDGAWQMILGVNTAPAHRQQGYAARLMERVIADTRAQGRKGCVLTCKQELIGYYKKFGFQDLGISQSAHAGQVWYDMVLQF